MRRPNRSIEVFDISLMAVVTKAMGAFLVLMLLLMPYYTSEPLTKSASELQKALADAEAKLVILIERLKKAERDPSELLRLLEDLRRQLDEAKRLMALLKRDNDALNSQVRRLEAQEAELRRRITRVEAQNDELRRKLNDLEMPVISGQLLSWNCTDARIQIGLWSADAESYIEVPVAPAEDKKAEEKSADEKKVDKKEAKDGGEKSGERKASSDKDASDKSTGEKGSTEKPVKPKTRRVQTRHVMKYWQSWGTAETTSDQDVVSQKPVERSKPVGTSLRFNHSYFRAAMRPGNYFVVLAVRSQTPRNVDGRAVFPLKRASAACRAIVSVQYFIPKNNNSQSFYTTEQFIPKGEYAIIESELDVKADTVQYRAVSTQAREWLKDQITHAEKEDVVPPPTPEEIERQRLESLRRQQEAENQRREAEARRLEFEKRQRERREEFERLRKEREQREAR